MPGRLPQCGRRPLTWQASLPPPEASVASIAMTCISRSLLFTLAVAAPWSHAAADPALVGCWRAAKIVLTTPDGEKAEDTSGRCTLRFQEDAFESTCKTTRGTATTTYRYRMVRPQVYAATMAKSGFRTEMVGSTREYEYRIEGDRLRTVTVPPSMAFAAAASAQRVETEAERMPCP